MRIRLVLCLVASAPGAVLVPSTTLAQNATAASAPQTQNPPPTPAQQPITPEQAQAAGKANAAAVRLTLQDALALARKNSTQFTAAVTNAGLAREDRTQARNALLPSAVYNNSDIYTQSIGLADQKRLPGVPPVIFIANNAVHEYLSQADVHEAIDVAAFSNYRRAAAAAAVARAQAEIASRGLVVTVTQNYFNVEAAQQNLEQAKKTAAEGDRFLKITQDLERGGEVAHSDVIKAELQARERQRQLQEAELAYLNARLNLAVLIFPEFNENYEVTENLHATAALPSLEEVQQQAGHNNPQVRAALATVEQANHEVLAARAGYFPTLTLDYFYGIDAPVFGTHTPYDGVKVNNLGSSIVGSLNIPLWNWGTTQSRVRQASLRRDQAKRELSFAQRTLLAEIQSMYSEASTALSELEGLARSAQLAAESQQLVTLRYQNGEATVLEVVDAQTTLATTNAAYQAGAVRYRVALANLQTLTGVQINP